MTDVFLRPKLWNKAQTRRVSKIVSLGKGKILIAWSFGMVARARLTMSWHKNKFQTFWRSISMLSQNSTSSRSGIMNLRKETLALIKFLLRSKLPTRDRSTSRNSSVQMVKLSPLTSPIRNSHSLIQFWQTS